MKKIPLLVISFLYFSFTYSQWTTSGNSIFPLPQYNGNVGIGTTLPGFKLDVVGSIRSWDGNTTGVQQNVLNLGNWSSNLSVPQYKFFTDDLGGISPLEIRSSRWGGGLLLTRDDPNGLTNLMRVGGWNGIGSSLMLYNQNNQVTLQLAGQGVSFLNGGNVGIGTSTPGYHLDVTGLIHTYTGFVSDAPQAGAFAAWFRGYQSGNGNIILQGGAGTYEAYWMTASNGFLKIGATGGSEPSLGVINISNTGQVGIGTVTPGSYKLAVEGKIAAREIRVTAQPFQDYVFNNKYPLRDLNSLEKYINEYRHLPGIPSAEEVSKNNGIELGEMSGKLLEKVEELTLYIIELNKKIEKLEKEKEELQKK